MRQTAEPRSALVAHRTSALWSLNEKHRLTLSSGGQINTRLASDLCTRYTGYTSATVVDATATSVVHNNWFVDKAIVVSWTYGEMSEKTASSMMSTSTIVPTAADGVIVTATAAPSPGLPDTHRLRTTATTIAVAVGCAIGAVVLLGLILGLITLRRHRKQKAQAQARIDGARLGQVRVRSDMPPPSYEARQSMETLQGYEARNESQSSLSKI